MALIAVAFHFQLIFHCCKQGNSDEIKTEGRCRTFRIRKNFRFTWPHSPYVNSNGNYVISFWMSSVLFTNFTKILSALLLNYGKNISFALIRIFHSSNCRVCPHSTTIDSFSDYFFQGNGLIDSRLIKRHGIYFKCKNNGTLQLKKITRAIISLAKWFNKR